MLIDGGHLILIFNAAIPNPNILRILPKYAFRHYTYLRDKYPNCFPEPTVSFNVTSASIFGKGLPSNASSYVRTFLALEPSHCGM